MGAPIGTVGAWLRGGGAGFWSDDCQAALIACGINPDAAGGYKNVSDALQDARAEHRDKRIADASASPGRDHESNCGLSPRKTGTRGDCTCYESPNVVAEMGALNPPATGPETWLLANSEAGHIGADGLMRTMGGSERGSACENQVPGYRPNDSFTVLHHGEASTYGMHNAVREREQEHEGYLKQRYPTGTIPPSEVDRGIENNARMTANYTGAGPRYPELASEGDRRAIDAANNPNSASRGKASERPRRQREDAHRRSLAQATDNVRGQLTNDLRDRARADPSRAHIAAKVDEFTNGPSSTTPTKKAVEKAAKCIADKAKQTIHAMQRETVDTNSTVSQSQACADAIAAHNADRVRRGLPPPHATKFSDLPPNARRDVLQRAQPEIAAREAALSTPPSPDTRTPAQRNADCLERQGNMLAPAMRNDGTFGPMVGGSPSNTPNPSRRNRTGFGRTQPPR
jgi:hypothetical protein